jgi:formylglycine-generating enzyme required for sulfatase activity
MGSQYDPHGHDFDYEFAISCHEVTVEQFQRFDEAYAVRPTCPTDDSPANEINWYTAAEYCNWLNAEEGIPEDQWVYVPNQGGKYGEGMTVRENYHELVGYRLPTLDEWRHACLTRESGNFTFGEPIELLSRYSVFASNSGARTHPVGSLLPNAAGLFDLQGNVDEWKHDCSAGVAWSPVNNNTQRRLSGGSFESGVPADFRVSGEVTGMPYSKWTDTGFRVARTYRLLP